jgi:hypothetical protein
MAIPVSLAPAARAAYRAVLRSARITFAGDPIRHAQLATIMRATFESPTLTAPGKPTPASLELEEGDGSAAPDLTSPAELEKRIKEWTEVAHFLRQNVVQGRLNEETGTYSELERDCACECEYECECACTLGACRVIRY